MSYPYDPDAIDADEGDDLRFDYDGFEASKDIVVVLVDADSGMLEPCPGDEDQRSYLQCTIDLTHQLMKDKVIASSSDELAVVFYNTRETKNSSAFDNVYVFLDLDAPDASRIRQLAQLTTEDFQRDIGSATTAEPAAALKFALWTASQIFTSKASKAVDRKIFLFTNTEDPCAGSSQPQSYRDQLMARCQELADAGVTLNLFPLLVVERPFSLGPFWGEVLRVVGPPFDDQAGGLEDVDVASKLDELLDSVKRVMHRKRALASLRWTLAPDLEIGLQVFTLVMPATKGSTTYLRAADHQPLRSETAYICADTGAILRPDTDVQKFRYDVKSGDPSRFPTVVFLSSERRQLKVALPPGLRLLGFKPASSLQPFHQLSHAYLLRPTDKELQGSSTLYLAILRAMRAQRSMAVCSYVRTKASEPRLVALLPEEDSADDAATEVPGGLYMIPLPFADDLRNPEEDPSISEPAKEAAATEEQVEAAAGVVNGLPLQEYASGIVPNPAIQRHFQVLEALALEEPVPPRQEFEDDTVVDLEGLAPKVPLLEAFRTATGLPAPGEGLKKAAQKRARPAEDANAPPVSIKKLAEEGGLDRLTVPELKEYLQRHKLKVSGKKADLVQRIREHLGLE